MLPFCRAFDARVGLFRFPSPQTRGSVECRPRQSHVFKKSAVTFTPRPAVLGFASAYPLLFQGLGEWLPSFTPGQEASYLARTHLSEGLMRGLDARTFLAAWP